MAGDAQPLTNLVKLVNDDGTPTPYFTRWAQQRQIDITNAITQEQAQKLIDDWAANRVLTAGVGLDGGGDLSADRTFDLADTAVVPAVYGDASHVPQITVDQQGRITAAVEVPVSGGGGGGLWYFNPPLAVDLPTVLGSVSPTIADDADVGLLFDPGNPIAGDYSIGAAKALPGAVDWSLDIKLEGGLPVTNYSNYGILISDAARTKVIAFMTGNGSYVFVTEYNLPNGFIAGRYNNQWYLSTSPFMRVEYINSSQTYNFYISFDGKSFAEVFSYSTGVLGTPGFIGVGVGYNRTTEAKVLISCPRWVQSW